MIEKKLIRVLIVDDDPEDVSLTQEVLELSKLKLDLSIAKDGLDAIEILQGYLDTGKGLPDLILLDLNMPRMNGHEFIEELKKNEELKKIPVVILTTSDSELDVAKSYNLGASCYVTKPVGLDEFQKVVQSINNFWFTVVKYPDLKNRK